MFVIGHQSRLSTGLHGVYNAGVRLVTKNERRFFSEHEARDSGCLFGNPNEMIKAISYQSSQI
jgi:hypothetical protein